MAVPLSAISSRYQTLARLVPMQGSINVEIVEPNAKRFFIRFENVESVGLNNVVPVPCPLDFVTMTISNLPVEYKFNDAPSIVQGAFIACGNLGSDVRVIECVYLD